MKKILVPTDFSDNAIVSGNVAIKIAEIIKAEIEFIHSYSYINSSFQSEVVRKIQAEESLTEAQLEMDKYLSNFQFNSINYSIFFSNLPLIKSLENIEEDSDVKLIVMGTNGASGLNYFLGSNSLEVAKKSQIPLLIVPLKSDLEEINKIVFFTDFQPQDLNALQTIQNLFSEKDLTYELIHFQDKSLFSEEENRLRLENLQFESKQHLKTHKISSHLYNNEADLEGVTLVVKEKMPDIISLSLKDKSFWNRIKEKSLSKAVILNPSKPIFIFNNK